MKNHYLKFIERYLNGEMTEAEKNQFEKSLQEDPALKKEYEEHIAIYEALGDKETLELRRSLKKIGEEFDEKKNEKGRRRDLNNFLWIAAMLIISISFISVTYLLVKSPIASHIFGLKIGAHNIENQIYRLEPAYAEAVKYRVRSEGFHLAVPHDSLVVEKNADILFKWNLDIREPITLDVMNKFGKIVFSSKRSLTSPFVFDKNLPNGIYVFRFRTDKATLYTGLFYVV